MYMKLKLGDHQHIKKVSEIASKQKFSMWVSTDTTMLDVRSLLGLMSLAGKEVNIVADDNADATKFYKAVQKMQGSLVA